MKKLTTLTFALFFMAGVSFAQNNATTTQSGNGNDALIEQDHVGLFGTNEAAVTQIGDNNEVENLSQYGSGNRYTVEQDGTGNLVTSFPKQGDEGPSYGGFININQIGQGNIVHDADQTGVGNMIRVNQDGRNNFVDIESQSTPGFLSHSNMIQINQLGDGNAVGTGTATGAYQAGSRNSMNITQEDGASAGTETVSLFGYPSHEGGQGLVQLGYRNNLTIDQDGPGNEVRFSLQVGFHNEASIIQGNGTNTADVWQVGIGNSASVTQNGTGGPVVLLQ